MKTITIMVQIVALAMFSSTAVSGSKNAYPPTPFEDHGACPFECCVYREWFAKGDIKILKDRKEGSHVAFEIKEGERVTALTGVVVTTKPGMAKVRKAIVIKDLRVNSGETVYLLTYRGEGVYAVWYQGRFVENIDVMENIEIFNKPKSVWWVKIKNKKGQTGWTNEPGKFGNKDRCS